MAEVQIKKVGITHELILNWLMLNPEKTQNECAEAFDITPAWLSVVINSDAFQARWLARRQLLDEKSTALAEMKMRGVVDKGLDRLEKMVEVSVDPEFVLNTTDKLLGRLGYGPKSAALTISAPQQNNYFVSKDVLAEARQLITAQAPPARALGHEEIVEQVDRRGEGVLEEEEHSQTAEALARIMCAPDEDSQL